MKKLERGSLLFLGTGSSLGVPVVSCACAVCHSKNSQNKRYRSSALLTVGQKKILIDCGPDYRSQALKYEINFLDGLILTHSHYDHTSGIDELRVYSSPTANPLPCLLCNDTLKDLQRRFYYLFKSENESSRFKPKFDLKIIEDIRGDVEFLGLRILYTSYKQAGMRVNGFRFNNLAYISDIREFDESIYDDLKDLDVLIISALRFIPSPLHFSVDEAVTFINRCKAKKGWLMHISHEIEHFHVNAYLPENIRMAYDGLEISFDLEGVYGG
jgi:phosphoribosyl 1,2-cyclic phosphate phosphodiesterase